MDQSQCISNTIWESYAAKTLKESDLLKLQKHAANCEICADIKEGIDALTKPENLDKNVQEINARVDTYLQEKKQKNIFWMYTGIAAIFIALLSITWILRYNSSNDLTSQAIKNTLQNQSPEITLIDSAKISTKIIESTIEPKPKPQLLTLNKKTKSQERKTLLTESIQSEATIVAASEPTTNAMGLSVAKMELKDTAFIVAMADKTEEEDVKVAVQESINVQEQKMSTKRAIRKANKEIYPSNYLSNNMNNNLSNTNEPGYYKNIVTNSPLSDSINYSKAQLFFESKAYDSCNYYVYPIINNPTSNYYEEALLLKAKSLLNQNKKTEAKAILKQVISLKKAKALEAKVLLNGIE